VGEPVTQIQPEGPAGPVPLPFREFLIKVQSSCNLACDYCYVYRAADSGWRTQPRTMAAATAEQVCHRIAEHARDHALSSLQIVLHGGEPLLAGPSFLDALLGRLRTVLPSSTRADLVIQTNGTLVDDAVLALCHEYGVRLGVSLDGGRAVNDLHRVDHAGRGSHDAVAKVLRRLGQDRHRPVWAGLLCTVDVTTDPVAVYDHLLSFQPPAIDLMLPLGNWDHPPPHRSADPAAVPYADWLRAVFDRWYPAPGPPTRIPFLEAVIDLVLGGAGGIESVGGGPSRMVVVDTDGSLTQSDQLKTAYDGAPGTGRDVWRDSFDTLLTHPGFLARQAGTGALCEECRACPVLRVCGGGHYPHRYRQGSGFANPSVYSPDLRSLIGHVSRTVLGDLDRLIEGGLPR